MICFVCKCSYNRWALDIRWTGERGYYWKRAGQSDLACNRTIYAFTFHFYFEFSLFITIGGQVWEGGIIGKRLAHHVHGMQADNMGLDIVATPDRYRKDSPLIASLSSVFLAFKSLTNKI